MTPSDVRIGNWVLIPTNNEIKIPCFPKKIKAITLFGEFDFTEPAYSENHLVAAKNCIGVELNDDWLVRFGFELYTENNEISIPVKIAKRHPLWLRLLANEWTLFVREGGGAFKSIKYVHQLQNVYYSLTGRELVLADA